jgi:predicted ATPase
VFATMGDGIAVAFASADAALQAAVDGQQAMPATGLRVRMGLHTGEVERRDDDFRGRPVNRAARIMAAGHGGQILLSDVTAALVATGPNPMRLIDLGVHHLRDLAEPERLWQVSHPALDQQFPPVRGLDTYSNNLPLQRSSLVGRERELASLAQLVERCRIVTVTGVGGVGKTRLALQAAADLLTSFDKVWFVELASITDPDDVADAIAVTLGAFTAADPLAAAAGMLGGGRPLLVVDNCEHLVDAAAGVIDALLTRCSALHVVATSREALGIEDEHVVSVRTLDPVSAAPELFRQRSGAAGADVDAMDPNAVEQICRRLDGIPLAIELAAAQAATLGLAEIIVALDDRFGLLSGGRRRAVDRHATMRATIDWSYRLLPPDERRLFQWLAVFSNGFELDAARFVGARLDLGERDASERVSSLVQKSMITAEPTGSALRYRMLESMRAFAFERLDEHHDRERAADAHAEWVATITDLPASDPCSAQSQRNSIRLERESDNWREAVLFALRRRSGALGARLCGPPTAFFLLGRHDLSDVVRPLLDLVDDDPLARRAVLSALVCSSAGAADHDVVWGWAAEVQSIDAPAPTGLGGLMQWFALAWQGRIDESIDVCVANLRDERLPRPSRDLFVAIATHDRFSLTDATADTDGLVDQALEVVARADVGVQRVACLLGVAWALADLDAETSVDLVRRALDDIADVPPLMRLTLPGSASRLLTRLNPQSAARGLLQQLDDTATRRTFVDFVPLFYGAALLHRVGHPVGATALTTLMSSSLTPYLSMMGFVEVALDASVTGSQCSLDELEVAMRAALTEVATGDAIGLASA